MIETLFPPGVAVSTLRSGDGGCLLAEEERVLGRVSDGRRREFAAGRTCARRAMVALGLEPVPVLIGEQRQPIWPPGVVGSITHTAGYSAAAVAAASVLRGVGVDAERHAALPPDVEDVVCRTSELEWSRQAPRGVAWTTLVFSAKESLFKAWYPLTGSWLDFDQAEVEAVDPARATFTLRVDAGQVDIDAFGGSVVRGRYAVDSDLIVTAVTVERLSEPSP